MRSESTSTSSRRRVVTTPDAPRGPADGGRRRRDRTHGVRLRVPVDGGPPLPDPRSPWQPRRRPRAQPDLRHGRVRVARRRLARPRDVRGLGGVFYELHVGTFTPAALFDAATEPARPPGRLGVDVVELMPVAAFPGRTGGGTTGSTCTPSTTRTAARRRCSGSSTPATQRGIGVCLDVVYNHLGPERELPAAVRSVLHRPAHDAVGSGGEPRRRRAPTRCAGSSSTTRCAGSATSISTRCAWTRSTSCATTRPCHLLAQLSDEVAALAGRLGRALALVAESDLNDPVVVTPTSRGRAGG